MKAYVLVGNSKRLKKKHLIEVVPGKRLIDIVAENLQNLGLDVVIYSKYSFETEFPLILDSSPWILPSIISLFSLDSEFFVFGGDMPMVQKEAIENIISSFDGEHTVVPRWRNTGYLEPLHALYTSSSLSCLKNGTSLTGALSECPAVRFVPAEEMPAMTFFNVNTAEDMEKLREMLLR